MYRASSVAPHPQMIDTNQVAIRRAQGENPGAPALRGTQAMPGAHHSSSRQHQRPAMTYGNPVYANSRTWMNFPNGQLTPHIAVNGTAVYVNLGNSPMEAMTAIQEFDQTIRASVIAAHQQTGTQEQANSSMMRAIANTPNAQMFQRAAAQAGHAQTLPNLNYQNHAQHPRTVAAGIDGDLGIETASMSSRLQSYAPQSMLNSVSTGTALDGASFAQGHALRN